MTAFNFHFQILRKLSLSSGSRSPSPVASTTRSAATVLNNSKMKYCQQKNKSPSHRCYQIAPSPQHSVRLRFGKSAEELNYSMAAFDESDADRSLRNFKDLQKNNKRIFLSRDDTRPDRRQQGATSQIFMGPNMNNMMCLSTTGGRSKISKSLFPPDENGNRTGEIMFEKVQYDCNKRYFHDTPSTLSSPSRRSLSINNLDFTLASAASVTNRRLSFDQNPHSTWQNANAVPDEDVFGEPMLEFVDDGEDDLHNPWENDYRYHNMNKFKYEKIKFKNEQEHAWEYSLDTSAISSDSTNNNSNRHQASTNYWGGFFSAAAASSTNNQQIHPYNTSTKTTDIWENFQNKAYEIDFENWQSSRRSSIDTVETWIEDEVFDNSFNEELERRVAVVLRSRQQ
jgi:hypothetical protein